MARGGKRVGAGRKSNVEKGIPNASEIRRIPREILEAVDELITKQKGSKRIPRKYKVKQRHPVMKHQQVPIMEHQQQFDFQPIKDAVIKELKEEITVQLFQKSIVDLEQQNQTLHSRVKKLSEDVEVRDGVIEELKGHYENLKQRIEKKEQAKDNIINDLEQQLAVVKRQNESLNEMMKQLIEERDESKEVLSSRVKRLLEELDDKQQLIKKLKNENETLRTSDSTSSFGPETNRYELLRKVLIERQENAKDTRNWTELNKLFKELNKQDLLS